MTDREVAATMTVEQLRADAREADLMAERAEAHLLKITEAEHAQDYIDKARASAEIARRLSLAATLLARAEMWLLGADNRTIEGGADHQRIECLDWNLDGVWGGFTLPSALIGLPDA